MHVFARAPLLPALAALTLASCTAPPINIEIKDVGGEKVVTLFTLNLFGFRSSNIPCVRTIIVSNFDAMHEPHPAWTAAAGDEVQCLHVRSFAIGRAPPGFTETRHLAAGNLRGLYRIEVVGIGSGSYDAVF